MNKLGLNEIRSLFRDFYISKDHYPAKSASLIPRNDKSLLLINSGMAPLKPYFAGLEVPPSKRMTTCQKCIRTGDIENVGKTSRHGTFFEMLGNFSFGDYFKKQSLTWGWEFITEVLKMPKDKLWATVYKDDDQAYEIWKELGMPEERIVRLGKEDNFWEIGLGPCGPCSEIYFDRGEKYGCDCEDCKPGCDCDRYVEFWNHVFTQFSKEEDGSYSDLAHPNIDTGMGLERLACIMQGVDSIFDIDTIRHILDGVVAKSGVEYKDGQAATDISIRIITDHLRSMVFMIADGIVPSNEGRGYVLRRLIRRAARHGKLLGIKEAFLDQLCENVIEVSGEAYPELVEKRDYIKKIISVEESKFNKTINQGCEILEKYIEELKKENKTSLDGEKAFKLYDTYGFPLEVTAEILEENNMSVDTEGFNSFMEKQKELARAGRKNISKEAWKESEVPTDLPETVFTGYEKVEDQGKVLRIYDKDGENDLLEKDEIGEIYLDQSPFYAEGGGQIYDTGIIYNKNFSGKVLSVTKTKGIFTHKVEILDGTLETGDIVNCKVDVIIRNLIRRNHTATHLLHKALREVLGNHVEQAGSYVTDSGFRFDFSHFQPVTADELDKIEKLVNEKVNSFLPITTEITSIDEAMQKGAMALFSDKYNEKVRVVSCGDFSIELCGGTHLNNTGEVGAFKITNESGVAAGVRRIEGLTGSGVLKLAKEAEADINQISQILKCNRSNLEEKAKLLVEELKNTKKALEDIKKESMADAMSDISKDFIEIGNKKLLCKKFNDLSIDDLRNLSDDILSKNKSAVLVFATVIGEKVTLLVSVSNDLQTEGVHAGKLIKELAKAVGGGGGGKANMAQAGGKNPEKIDDAFSLAEELLK